VSTAERVSMSQPAPGATPAGHALPSSAIRTPGVSVGPQALETHDCCWVVNGDAISDGHTSPDASLTPVSATTVTGGDAPQWLQRGLGQLSNSASLSALELWIAQDGVAVKPVFCMRNELRPLVGFTIVGVGAQAQPLLGQTLLSHDALAPIGADLLQVPRRHDEEQEEEEEEEEEAGCSAITRRKRARGRRGPQLESSQPAGPVGVARAATQDDAHSAPHARLPGGRQPRHRALQLQFNGFHK
jgi:hypothetical protein